MGALRQFAALLWKNYIARKRHPVLFVLELLLPIIVFLTVGLMRRSLPPDDRSSCSYKERNLPSAGMIPFLQSSVCALDNPCVNETAVPEIAARQQQFRSLIADLGPTLDKPTTIEAMKSLPTVSSVFVVLKNSSDKINITSLEDKLKIRNMVKDSIAVHYILVDKYGILSSEAADSLLDSTLNAFELIGISAIDWKGITCDPKRLQKYVSFKKEVDVKEVSASLCGIKDEQISELTSDLLKQLDIGSIIEIAEEFAGMTGEVDMALLFEDLGGLFEMFGQSSNLLADIKGLDIIEDLPAVMSKMTKLIPLMSGMAELDMNSLGIMYEIAKPMLSVLIENDSELFKSLDAIFLGNMTDMLSDPDNIDWEQMLGSLGPMSDQMEMFNLPQQVTPPSEDIAVVIEGLFMNGSISNDSALNRSMDYIGYMMEQMLGPENMNAVMVMGENMMDTISDMRTMTTDLQDQLVYEVQTNPNMQVAVNKITEIGPEMGRDFLIEVVKVDNIYGLLTNEVDAKTLCEETANSKLADLSTADVVSFISVVCDPEVTNTVDAVFRKSSYNTMQAEMVSMMNEMYLWLNGTNTPMTNMTMTDMYYELTDMIENTETVPMIDQKTWEAILPNSSAMYDWMSVWYTVNENYGISTNLFLTIPAVGQAMQNSDMWEFLSTPVTMGYAIFDAVIKRAKALEEMSQEGTIMYKALSYLKYFPELASKFFQNYNHEMLTGLSSSTMSEDLLTLMCNHLDWKTLGLSPSVPVDDMKTFICSTDWIAFMRDVYEIIEPITMVSDVEDTFMSASDNGLDWSKAAVNIGHLTDIAQAIADGELFHADLDFEDLWTMFTNIGETLGGLTMESVSGDNLRSTTATLVTLDELFVDVPLWTRVKHYCQTWLYWTKTMNGYVEASQEPGFNITEYINQQSPTLGAHFKDAAHSIPDLTEVLIVENMAMIFTNLLSVNYDTVCNGTKLSSSVVGKSTSLAMLEDSLCEIDLEAINNEMRANNPHYDAYLSQIEIIMMDTNSLPPVMVNWTDLILSTEEYLSHSSSVLFGDDLNFDMSTLPGNLNMTIDELVTMAEEVNGEELIKLLENVNDLYSAFQGDSSVASPLIDYMVSNTYYEYHIMKFLNKQMAYFNGSAVVDLKTYMGSSEADKLLDVFVKSPELVPVLFETLKSATFNNNQLTSLPLEQLCNKTAPTFSKLITRDPHTTMTDAEIQDLVCAVDIDWEKLIEELRVSLDGFDELISALEHAMSPNITNKDLYVNYTVHAKELELWQQFLQSLIESPPTVVITGIRVEDHIQELVSVIEEELKEYESELNNQTFEKIIQSLSSQAIGTFSMVMSEPEALWGVASLYVGSVQNMINLAKILMMEPGTRTGTYPEMQKVWDLMDWFPEVFVTYTYTNENYEQKILKFIETLESGTDALCMANPDDLMTVPPEIVFDFTEFFNKFCAIDIDALTQEMEKISSLQEISDAYAGMNSSVNASKLTTDIEALSRSVTDFFSSSDSWYIPRFLNETVWEAALEFVVVHVLELDMSETNGTEEETETIKTVLNQIEQNLLSMLDSSPELGAILQITHTYVRVLHRMVSLQQGTFLEDDIILDQYPNVKVIWSLMQELPDVAQTFLYTTITEGHKVTKFFDALAKDIDIFCMENPDDLMTVLPGSTFSFKAFFDKFCSLNLDALELEALGLPGGLQEISNVWESTNGTTNVTKLMADVEHLMTGTVDVLTRLGDIHPPAFLDLVRWEEVMQPVLESLMNSSNIDQIPSTVDLFEGIFGGETSKILATMNVITEEVIKSLEDANDTTNGVIYNVTDVVQLLESLEVLSGLLEDNPGNLTIDPNKLNILLADPQSIVRMCENNTLAQFLTLPGHSMEVAETLAEIMCISPATLAESLQDQIDTQIVEQKINDIWNDRVTPDWSSLSSNIDKLTSLLMSLVETEDPETTDLQEWLDSNTFMDFITSTYTNPRMIFSVLKLMDLDLGYDGNMFMTITSRFTAHLVQRLKAISDDESLSDTVKLYRMVAIVGSADEWLHMLADAQSKYVMTAAGKVPAVREFVCTSQSVEYASQFYDLTPEQGAIVGPLLCGLNNTLWYQTLVKNNFTYTELVALQNMFEAISPEPLMMPSSWSEILENMSETSDTIANIDFEDFLNDVSGEDFLENAMDNIGKISEDSTAFLLDLLFGDSNMREVRDILEAVAAFLEMLNKELTDYGSLSLEKFLPDSEKVTEILQNSLSEENIASLMTALIDPEKFISVMLGDDWDRVVCDPEEFNQLFTFPEGTDVTDIQQDLCNSVGEMPSLDELFGESTKDIVEKLSNIVNGGSTSDRTVGSLIVHISDQMTKMLDHINFDTAGMEDWFAPIINYLESPDMSLTNSDSLMGACDSMLGYVQNTDMYRELFEPMFDSYFNQIHVGTEMLQLVIDMHSTVCVGDKDIVKILEDLQDSTIPSQLQSVTEQLTGSSSQDSMTCKSMIDSYDSYSSLVETAMNKLFAEGSDIFTCMGELIMKSGEILEDTSKFLSLSDQIAEILQDEQVKMFLETVSGTDDAGAMFQEFVNLYTQQQKSQESLKKLLEGNMTNLMDFFENSFNLGQEQLSVFIDGTFDLDLDSLTAEQLIDKVCNDGDLDALYGEDSVWGGSLRELRDSLCGPDKDTALEVANYLLQLSKVTNGLENIETEDLLGTLSDDIADLIRDIEGVSDLAIYVERLSSFDIESLNGSTLATLQRLLLDKGPDRLLKSLNNFLDNFAMDEDSSKLIEDLKMIADGVFAFKSLRHIFMANVRIENLVHDKEALKLVLTEKVGLSEEVAIAVVEGSLSFEMLLNASNTNVSGWVCDPDQLAELIKDEEETGLDITYVSKQFCSLDSETVSQMLEELLQQLDVGDLLEEMIVNGIGSLLSEANTTVEDTKKALVDIQIASEDLQKVFATVEEYLDNVPTVSQALSKTKTEKLSYGVLSELVCGDPIEELEDQLNYEKFTVKRPELTESQLQEMAELPGEKCKEMYREIMAENVGPIIWGYLKPLLRGKIVYAPNTAQVRSLINEMNTTFSSLESVFTLTKAWAEGTVSLKDLLADDGAADIQEIFNNTLVQNILSSLSGTSSEGLEDMIYQLNDMDTGVVNGLVSVAQWAADYLECVELDRFQGYDTEAEMEAAASRFHFDRSLLAGIVFTNVPSGREKRQASSTLPPRVEYKIRMNIDSTMQTRRIKQLLWRPYPEDQFTTELRYFRGFIQLQDIIDQAIITHHAGTGVVTPSVNTMQTPFPCYSRDSFVNAFGGYGMPITMTMAWIVIISVAVNFLVYDRESGQEETLKAMGMTSALNWWAWFVTSMLMMALVDLIVTAILMGMEVFTYSNFGIIYLYFLDFLFSTLMLSYFVSAFFTRPAMAILASLIVYILSYLPFVILFTLEEDMTFWQKSLACLSSTTAFSFSAVFVARFEETQEGLQWDNIDISPIRGEDFTFSWGCIMMLIDAFIYLILGFYVRNVKPGKYGLSQPWYFIVCPSYWCSLGSSKDQNTRASRQDAYVEDNKYDTPVVMSVRGLVKEFKKGERAVNNLSLDIHGGSVTTLLGHNGAAKTTTMKMLIGQLEPTSGEITVFGHPVSKMRESLGVCPQHNSLYEYMTVLEHMKFYSSIKSNPKVLSDKQEIEKLLVDVGLWNHRYQRVNKLSGGMQRRLCVALAFVGGSKLVILDEPTSGVDPSGRRAIWNLILRQKYDVAVLLSTHHMDEADVISDQVVIMHNGRLLSQGSPIFLKNNFSAGHRLTVVKDQHYDANPSQIFDRLKRMVPEVKIQQVYGHEIQFVLPPLRIGMFYDLFTDLEEHKAELNIESYGVSDPTLEEVFLKVCSAADSGIVNVTPETVREIETEQPVEMNAEKSEIEESVSSSDSFSRKDIETGSVLGFSQFKALLIKRFHHYRRDYRMMITILLLPMILFLAACGFYSIKPDSSEAPSLLLTPSLYGPDSYGFFKMKTSEPLPNAIIDSFMHSPGIGTSCMAGMDLDEPFKCVTPDQQFTEESTMKINATCYCDDHKYVCDKEPAVNHPRHMRTMTTDILQDLTGKEVDKYLLQSFHSYIERRYGGWVFSDKNDPSRQSDVEATIWYNSKGYHSLPAFYNAYSNGLLRSLVGGDPEQYGITTYSHPFLFDKEQMSSQTLYQSFADMGIAFCIVIAFTFIPAGILMYIVTENANREKQLQMISGISPLLYWISALIWDMLMYGIAVGIAVIIMAIFQLDAFWDRENVEGIVVLMFLFGWTTLCLMYCTSRFFKDVATAFFVMFCSLVIIGIMLSLVLMTMEYFIDSESVYNASKVFRGIFLIVPTFAFANGLIEMITNQIRADIFARFNTDVYQSPFSTDIAGWNMLALGIEGLVFFVLAILLDIRCRRSRRYRFESPFTEEEDVAKEFKRIEQGYSNNDVVLVQNLHKVFKGGDDDIHAVNGLSFGVQAGECFGLLGVNGAGKTTTFNILTGVLDSTEGNAVIMGRRKIAGLGNLGYCPQDDSLDPYLTVVEMLFFHSKLKGIPKGKRHRAVYSVMERLQLLNIQNKVVKNCSGGMKRKLCLAIALLGDPDVVLLDEPTTGMDPKAKRLVWDYLLTAKDKGMSIILTSHSMEECDILCNKIGIMVNGRFKCLGSSQHLKEKYGNGYTVKLSFSGLSTTSNMIQELIENFFPSAQIREFHQSVLQLDLPRDTYRLTDLLHILEKEKERYNILYYTVAQTTLDTIFLNFAREQTDGTRDDETAVSSSVLSLEDNSITNSYPSIHKANSPSHMFSNETYSRPYDNNVMIGQKQLAAGRDNDGGKKLDQSPVYSNAAPEHIYPKIDEGNYGGYDESVRL